jgi:hypothetical protein
MHYGIWFVIDEQWSGVLNGRRREKARRPGVRCKQRFHFTTKCEIAFAGVVQEPSAVYRLERECYLE